MEYSPDRQLPQRSDLRHPRPQLHRPGLHQQRLQRLADDHHQPDDAHLPGRLRPVHRRQHQDAAARRAARREPPPTSPRPGDGSAPSARPARPGAATLSGGASIANDHLNYLSPPGFIAGLTATGADASWQLLGAPAGTADVTIRYSNYTGGDGNPESRTESLVVNGTTTQVTLPTTVELGRLVHRHRPGHPDRGHQHRRPGLRERQRLQRQHRRHRCQPRPARRAAPFLPAEPARRLHPLLRLGQRHLHRPATPDVRDLHRQHPADGRRAARPVRLVPARRLPDRGVDLGRLDRQPPDRRHPGRLPVRLRRRTTPAPCPTWPS